MRDIHRGRFTQIVDHYGRNQLYMGEDDIFFIIIRVNRSRAFRTCVRRWKRARLFNYGKVTPFVGADARLSRLTCRCARIGLIGTRRGVSKHRVFKYSR